MTKTPNKYQDPLPPQYTGDRLRREEAKLKAQAADKMLASEGARQLQLPLGSAPSAEGKSESQEAQGPDAQAETEDVHSAEDLAASVESSGLEPGEEPEE